MAKVRFKEISPELKTLAAPGEGNTSTRVSVGNEKVMGEMIYIKPEYLIPYSKQSRKIFNDESLNELAKSIENVGVRQPLTIIKSPKEDKFEIISGERRYRAAKIAGLQRIPCIIIKDAGLAEEIALVENIQRKDLHPLEQAQAFYHLLEKNQDKKQEDVAEAVGISPSKVSEYLKLLELPKSVQNYLLNNNITERKILRELGTLTSAEEMLGQLSKLQEVSRLQTRRARKSRKNLLNLLLDDNKIVMEFKKTSLTEEQKEDIRSKINKYLDNI